MNVELSKHQFGIFTKCNTRLGERKKPDHKMNQAKLALAGPTWLCKA